MAIIEKKILVEGSKGKEEFEALFDSGVTYSCIRKNIAEKLEFIIIYDPKVTRLRIV